jgi:hypothetical protein
MAMKVNGKAINGPRVHTLVLPYGDGDDFIVFKFRGLTTKDDFEAVMARPKPPTIQHPGKEPFKNLEDANYRASMQAWGEKKINWEFLKSISVTDGLEWATVDMANPETWGNWRKDIEDNFGVVEFSRIFGGFLEANSLSDERIEEARARFLASQVAAVPEG